MLIFCNYLEAHIMMYDIKLIRVFLSCYKRILLSHQIIVSSRTHATSHPHSSSTLHYHSPSLLLPHPSTFPKKQKRRPEKTFLVEKERRKQRSVWRIRRIKVVWKKRRKHRGWEGIKYISMVCLFTTSSLFFFTTNASSPPSSSALFFPPSHTRKCIRIE